MDEVYGRLVIKHRKRNRGVKVAQPLVELADSTELEDLGSIFPS